MHMLAFALTVALAAEPSPVAEAPAPAAEPSPAAEAPAAEPTPAAGAPAPAAEPSPVVYGPAPAPAPTPVAQLPPLKRPGLRGTGSLVIGSLAAVSGLGLGIASVAELDYCERGDCEEGVIFLPAMSVGLHVLAIATLAPGAALRGRHEARRDLSLGTPRDGRARGLNIAGIATLGAGGALLLGGVAMFRLGDPDHASSRGFALLTASFSTIEVGAGLLAYARTYRKHANRRVQARLLPQLAHDHVGLTLVGRF